VHAPEAWAAGCLGTGVRVAIVDGGLYDAHLDLTGQVDVAASASFVRVSRSTRTWNVLAWHARGGYRGASANGLGTVGIAPEATIIGVKVLHNGSGPSAQ